MKRSHDAWIPLYGLTPERAAAYHEATVPEKVLRSLPRFDLPRARTPLERLDPRLRLTLEGGMSCCLEENPEIVHFFGPFVPGAAPYSADPLPKIAAARARLAQMGDPITDGVLLAPRRARLVLDGNQAWLLVSARNLAAPGLEAYPLAWELRGAQAKDTTVSGLSPLARKILPAFLFATVHRVGLEIAPRGEGADLQALKEAMAQAVVAVNDDRALGELLDTPIPEASVLDLHNHFVEDEPFNPGVRAWEEALEVLLEDPRAAVRSATAPWVANHAFRRLAEQFGPLSPATIEQAGRVAFLTRLALLRSAAEQEAPGFQALVPFPVPGSPHPYAEEIRSFPPPTPLRLLG